MKIVFDDGDADYEDYEARLVEEIVSSVRSALQAAGIGGARLRDLVSEIAFDVGAIVDGSTSMSIDDEQLVPILGFAQGRMRDRLLLATGGGGSSLHEFVSGIVEDEFGGAAD
jgi:hypothetical protein